MPDPLTVQTLTENQRNVLSIALLNSERSVVLLNQALAAANARIAELEAAKSEEAASDQLQVKGEESFRDQLKVFAGGPPYDEPMSRVGNGADA